MALVGSDEEVGKLKGARTQVIDLAGRMVLPGLIDSHVHSTPQTTEFDHPIPDMESMADVLKYVAGRAAALGEGKWIEVRQVFITRLKEQRYPTREELDRVAPNHPVQFSTGPDSMLNSLALKLAGIDRNFKVPAGSEGVVVFEINGPFFFGAAKAFKEQVESVLGRPRVLILRMRNVPVMDSTGLHTLRALARRARGEGTLVLLADEPSGNLDHQAAVRLHDLLFQLRRDHALALVLVTHNLELAHRADRILRLEDGRLLPADRG